MKFKTLIFLISIFLVSFSQIVYSQSEGDVFFLGHQYGIGARALSMGGAFVGVADDYSATFWNPAGLVQIQRMEFFSGLSHSMVENDAKFNNISNVNETNSTKLNTFGFVLPYPTYRGSLVFAIGYNKVANFNQGLNFENWFDLNTDEAYFENNIEEKSGGLSNWVLSGALDITSNLSVGASLNIWRGKNDYNMIYDNYDEFFYVYEYDELNFEEPDVLYVIEDDSVWLNNGVYGEQTYNTNYSAISLKLGGLYRLGILGRVGAAISLPVTLKSEEDYKSKRTFTFGYYESADDPEHFIADYSIRPPFKFEAGAAITILPNLIMAADIEYSDWSQMKFTTDTPLYDLSKAEANAIIKRSYQATTNIRLGAEFTVPILNMQLRGGYSKIPSPIKSDNSSAGKSYLSAGVGILLDKQVKLDLTWLNGWWTRQSRLYIYDAPISEKIKVNKFLATIAFRF